MYVTLKKLKTFYHFFKTLALFSRLFPGLKNCWANFKIFSRIQDSVRTLCTLTNLWNHCLEHHSFLALVRQYMKASHTASHASCLIQDGGKKCSCINLYSPCLQSKSWGFHNLAKTFMYPIVYCIVALVLQFAYYYGKRYVVGLWENHSTQIHIHCTCFPGISSIGTKTISYSNTILEKISKIFSVPESFQVESFQQITWHLLHFEKKNTLTAVLVPY